MARMPGLIRMPMAGIASGLLLVITAVACGSEAAPVTPDEATVDRTGWPSKVRLGLIPTEANVMAN